MTGSIIHVMDITAMPESRDVPSSSSENRTPSAAVTSDKGGGTESELPILVVSNTSSRVSGKLADKLCVSVTLPG